MRWLKVEDHESDEINSLIDLCITERLGAHEITDLEYFSIESELRPDIDYTEEESEALMDAVDGGEIFMTLETGNKKNPFSSARYALTAFQYEGKEVVHFGYCDSGGCISTFFRRS